MKKSLGPKTWLYPMPVLIIGTYNENGKPNVMNAAWGGICNTNMISICLGEHKTTDNILRTKAFTVSIGDSKNVEACDYVGLVSGNDEKDKFKKSGFTAVKGEKVDAPIINELPITLECEFVSYEDELLIGNIVNVVVDEEICGEDGLPDLSKFSPITYDPVHHKYVALGEVIADAFKVGKNKM